VFAPKRNEDSHDFEEKKDQTKTGFFVCRKFGMRKTCFIHILALELIG
jgi:hypothetical protein